MSGLWVEQPGFWGGASGLILPVGGGTPVPPVDPPVFSVMPFISPSTGPVGTVFTGTDGTASNTTSYAREWKLNGVVIGTGTTVTPASAGTLDLRVTATGPGGTGSANATPRTVTAASGGTFAVLTVIGTGGVISNGGLTAATTTGDFVSAGAPGAAKTTGKYYFEMVGVIATPSSGGNGISAGLTTQDLNSYFGDSLGGGTRFVAGAIWTDGANPVTGLPFQNTGDVAGCCVDLGAGQIYFRLNAGAWSGPWPITTGGAPVMPGVTVTYVGDSVTCRFDPATWTQAPIDGSYGPWTVPGGSFDADVIAYDAAQVAAGGTALTDTRKTLLSTMVEGLKTDGIWAKLDRLTIMAAPNTFAARVDIRNPAKISTTAGTVTFVADFGYAGDNLTSSIDAGEPVVGGASLATLNSTSIGVYCTQQIGSIGSRAVTGTAESPYRLSMTSQNSGGVETYQANDATGEVSQNSFTRLGHRAISRASASSRRSFFNGALVTSSTTASTNASTLNQLIGRVNTSFSGDRWGAYWAGSALSDAEQTAMHNRLSTCLNAILPPSDPDVLTYDMAQQAAGGAPLTSARLGLLSTLVRGLKSAGVWNRLDKLVILAAPDQFSARTDLKTPVKPLLTANGTLTFTANSGYQGDGVTGYLSFVEFPNAPSNQFSQNSASVFAYCSTVGALSSPRPHIGFVTGANVRLDAANGVSATMRINAATGIALPSQGTRLGFRAVTRDNTTAHQAYFNPTTTTPALTGSVASAAVLAEPLVTHRSAALFSDDRVAVVGSGASLTGQNVLDLYNLLTTYLANAVTYDPDVIAYDDAQVVAGGTPLPAERMALLTTLVSGLKADGIWAKMDWFNMLAAPTIQAATLNMKNPTKFLTSPSPPTFTVDRGYTGNGTSQYLSTGENFGTGPNYTTNSASIGCFCSGGAFGMLVGTSNPATSTTIINATSATATTMRMNNTTGMACTTTEMRGMRIASTTAANTRFAQYNGVQVGTDALANVAPAAYLAYLHRSANVYGATQLSFYFLGGGLTPTEATSMYNRVTTFLGAINPPVFTVQPSISPNGGPAVVTVFTASDGTATGGLPSYNRRWLLDGVPIGTGITVAPTAAGSLVLEVTAANGGGVTVATSPAVTVTAAVFDPDVLAYDTAQQTAGGTPLAELRKSQLTQMVVTLKNAGVWALIDRLAILAGPTQFAARTDLKAPAKSLLVTGLLTFTTDRGYTSDASTGFLSFNEVPNVAGNQYAQNNASIFAYCNLQGTGVSAKAHLGCASSTNLVLGAATTSGASFKIHTSAGISMPVVASRTGFRFANRSTSTAMEGYRNPASTTPDMTGTPGTVAVPAEAIVTHRTAATFIDDRLAVVGYGGSMTGQQVLDFYGALNTFLTAISANLTGFAASFNSTSLVYDDDTRLVTRTDDVGRRAVRGNTGHTSGLWYAELMPLGARFRFAGVVDSLFTTNGGGGPPGTHRAGVEGQNLISMGATEPFEFAEPGDVVRIAWDGAAQQLWIKINNGDWNGDPGANPVTNDGGVSTAGLVGPAYIGATLRPVDGASVRYRLPGDLGYSLPSGFTEWAS